MASTADGGEATVLTPDDVGHAAVALRSAVCTTPTMRHPELDRRAGVPVMIKAESLQLTGSFKVRGALNWFARHGKGNSCGVAAFSAGNHAAGLAYAARRAGVKATVFMPRQAPAVKLANAQALGAHVISYDRETEDREALLSEHVVRTGDALIHPFENPDVIAGNGTSALELLDAARAAGVSLATIAVPCGGGGLGAGAALAADLRASPAVVALVEPVGWDDMGASLRTRRRLPPGGGKATICDALITPAPGERTFALHQSVRSTAVAVGDDEVRAAMRWAYRELSLILEPGGAVALAAALSGTLPRTGPLGILLTGANVDAALFADVLLAADQELCIC